MHDTAMSKLFPITFVLAFLAGATAATAQHHEFFNVGIKVGWIFGDGGGPVVGLEMSYTFFSWEEISHGPVIGADFRRGRTRLHGGYELVTPRVPIGVEVGPTLAIDGDGTSLGVHTTVFTGLFLYPYFSLTFMSPEPTTEAGAFLKLPVQVDDRTMFN